MLRALSMMCVSLTLAACQGVPAPGGVGGPPTEAAAAPAVGPATSSALRGLLLKVRGPADLRRGDGLIVADGLVAAGAGNLAADGLVAAGAGNFTASTDGVLSHNGGSLVATVDGAQCHCETLAGAHLGPVVSTGAAGDAGFPPMPPLAEAAVAVALFRVAGQAYRVAALVPAGGVDEPLILDPISTMIEAVARDAARRQPGAEILAAASLARIREICERHGLSADADDLVYPATDESSAEGLRKYWAEEIEEHVTDPRDRAALTTFATTVATL